jgi:hypothetical protein
MGKLRSTHYLQKPGTGWQLLPPQVPARKYSTRLNKLTRGLIDWIRENTSFLLELRCAIELETSAKEAQRLKMKPKLERL